MVVRLADLVFFFAISLIGATIRFEIEGWENFESIKQTGNVPVYTYWHDRIFLGVYFWRNRNIVAMTSQSLDGEYIARCSQRLGYGAIRGSSTRGGSRALVEMIKLMRKGNAMAFAIDGPRGPRYEAKPGPVLLAKKTGNPILPFAIESRKYWTVNSWDKMQIPKPFSRALTIIGEPIYVSDDADETELNLKLKELQRSLDDLTEQGKAWSGRKVETD